MNSIYEAQQKRKRHLAYICDAVLTEGRIIEKNTYHTPDGINVKSIVVNYLYKQYELVKNDGEWVSFNTLQTF